MGWSEDEEVVRCLRPVILCLLPLTRRTLLKLAPSYPRSTLRSILRTWSPHSTLSSNFDCLAYLSYLTFLQRLASASKAASRDTQLNRKGKKGRVVMERKEIRKAKRVKELYCL